MTAPRSQAVPAAEGLFDFQINGFAGVDFQRDTLTATDLRRAVDALAADGVSGIFLTLITAREEALCARFRRIEEMRAADPVIAQRVIGYHLEGPWLRAEPGYCGAHPLELMCAPTIAAFAKLQSAAGGRIRLVTLAPEWPGSADFISHLTQQGVHVSIGHSNASDAEIDAAIRAGARFCTHLGNGVPLTLPRHDNIVQRLLARDELIACLIPDGIHLPPFVLQNLFRAKPRDRVLFTTDAMAAAGAPPGRYSLGALEVTVGADGIVRGPGGGFAGSSLTPRRGVELTAAFLHVDESFARSVWSRNVREAFGLSADPAR
jgi:N-acetylglucosamine-6-phosphate deacetylase